jgi:methyltransferase (TIGR00027 family)
VKDDRPSRTAERVAERRAAHQILDKPPVFEDPLALSIVESEHPHQRNRSPLDRYLRAAFAARSRFAEDELRDAYARGVRQYVVLGAGFDTFAYRSPYLGLRVFEVDHPATQAEKRARLARRGIRVPPEVTYVPIDFSTTALADALVALDASAPAFFSWLGVVPYLEREAIEETLWYVATRPAGTTIVFDYGCSPVSLSFIGRIVFERIATRVAAVGEPFKSFFEPEEVETMLRTCGFSEVSNCSPSEINRRYFAGRRDGLRVGEMMHLAKGVV